MCCRLYTEASSGHDDLSADSQLCPTLLDRVPGTESHDLVDGGGGGDLAPHHAETAAGRNDAARGTAGGERSSWLSRHEAQLVAECVELNEYDVLVGMLDRHSPRTSAWGGSTLIGGI